MWQKFVAVRCWQVTSACHRHEGWLVGERATQGQPEARKYDWSHRSAETPLEVLAGLAHRRHMQEEVYVKDDQSVQEAHQGLGQYFVCDTEERLHQALGYRPPAAVYRS